jgi:hypothetical protein
MSVPTTIFIDTCILDEQNYNFSSKAISAFLEAVKGPKMVLLLPDPTRREIERHIEKRSQEAVKMLEEAERKAPFVKKWKAWPVRIANLGLGDELHQMVNDEWCGFLRHFEVENLGYDGVSVEEVMNWYDNQRAPFGNKRKRKEFPDAFALATLLAYTKSKGVSVAVVSGDGDFERACRSYDELLYFPSLSAFTEALLSPDHRVAQAKKVIESDPTMIIEKIKEEFPSLRFYHEEDYEADIEDIEVDNVRIGEVRIIHMEGDVVTIEVDATVNYSAHVRADDHTSASVDSSEDWYMVWREYRGTVQDQAEISAIAECLVSRDWMKVEEVETIEIQGGNIYIAALPDETFMKGED